MPNKSTLHFFVSWLLAPRESIFESLNYLADNYIQKWRSSDTYIAASI